MGVFWNYTLELIHIIVNFKLNIPVFLFFACFQDKDIVLRYSVACAHALLEGQ